MVKLTHFDINQFTLTPLSVGFDRVFDRLVGRFKEPIRNWWIPGSIQYQKDR